MRTPALTSATGAPLLSSRKMAHPKDVDPTSSAILYFMVPCSTCLNSLVT